MNSQLKPLLENDILNNKATITYFPTIQTAIQKLPYNNLQHTWIDFERLILRIIKKKESVYGDAQIYKKEGAKQEGIDIFLLNSAGEVTKLYQCKRYLEINKSTLKKTVDKFIKGRFYPESKEFVIATTADTSLLEDEILEYKKSFLKNSIKFEVWSPKWLDQFLKDSPQIVFEFFDGFNESADWVRLFCGPNYLNFLEFPVSKIIYDCPENYIPRLCDIKTSESDTKSLFFGFERNLIFSNYIESQEKPFKLLLKSNAGIGKTTELDYIAHIFSNEIALNDYYPIRYNLGNYSGVAIDDLLGKIEKKWSYIKNKLLLLFDGFDEISSNFQRQFISAIKEFLQNNKQVSIIISVRYNSIPAELNDFQNIELLELTDYQIYDFLAKNLVLNSENSIDSFIKEAKKIKVYDNLRNPFELKGIVEIYSLQKNFPKNKFNLLSNLIDYHFKTEGTKGRFKFEKSKHLSNLKILSVYMMLLDKQRLCQSELQEILNITDLEILEFKDSPFLKIDGESFEFIHNNYKEYFLALHLSNLSFDEVKKLVKFQKHDKLRPKWKNGMSFLFLSDCNEHLKEDLILYMNESDPLYLVGVEKDRISFESRFLIFKNVLENLNLYIHKSISFKDLFDFFDLNESPRALLYILEELKAQRNVFNGLYILRDLRMKFNLELEINKCLFEIICNPYHEPIIYQIAFKILAELDILQKSQLEYVLANSTRFNSVGMKGAIVKYFHDKNDIHNNLDFCLEAILNSPNKRSDEESFHSYSWFILDGLCFNFDIENDLKIISFISSLIEYDKFDMYDAKHEFFEKFFERIRNYGYQESICLGLLNSVFKSRDIQYRNNWLSNCFNYFKFIGQSEMAFWKIWEVFDSKILWLGSIIQVLISDLTIETMVQKIYLEREMTDELNRFRQVLPKTFEKKLIKEINALKIENLKLKMPKPYKNDFRSIYDLEIVLLKDKNTFLSNLKLNFFKNSSTLTFHKFKKISSSSINDKYYLSTKFLESEFLEFPTKIYFHSIEKYFLENKNWEHFALSSYYDAIRFDGKFLNTETTNHILELLDVYQPLNFWTARWFENNQWWYRTNELNFYLFYKLLKQELEIEVLRGLLFFDDTSIYQFHNEKEMDLIPNIIRAKLNDDKIFKNWILEDLGGNLVYPGSIGSHFKICLDLKIYEALPFLIQYLKTEKLFDNHMVRGFEIMIELGGDVKEFKDVIWNFDEKKDWHWYVIENLYGISNVIDKQIITILESITDLKNDEKHYQIAKKLLLKGKSHKGLELVESYLLKSESSLVYFKEDLFNSICEFGFESLKNILEKVFYQAQKYTGHFNHKMDFFINCSLELSKNNISVYHWAFELLKNAENDLNALKYSETFEKNYWENLNEFNSVEEVKKYLISA